MFTNRNRWAGIVLAGASLAVAFFLGQSSRDSHPQVTAAPPAQTKQIQERTDDKLAIQKKTQSFIKAFEAGDAKAVAKHWTTDGEYIADDGSTFRGRKALEGAYAGLFEKAKDLKVKVSLLSIRFVGEHTAIEEGYMSVTRGDEALPNESKYSVLHVRENGEWLMSVVREWPRDGYELRDLQWLIGSWKAEREGTTVTTLYRWNENKSFIRADFTVKTKDRTVAGTQIIGKDHQTGLLRAWTFEQDGGYGMSEWAKDGKKWSIESAGVTVDGVTTASTNIITPLDANTFTWQAVNRTLDGVELEDIAPLRITRVTPEK